MMVSLVMPMVRVLQVMLRLTVPLVTMMVRVLQVAVLGVGPCVGGCWPVLGVGARHSWQRARWAALLAGLPASPVGASGVAGGEGAVSDVLGVGVACDVVGEGAAGDATAVAVSGDAYGEGVAGDGVVGSDSEGVALGGWCPW